MKMAYEYRNANGIFISEKTCYEILGVEENATQVEIKKAYHKLARELHTDKGGDKDKFQELSNAYDLLKGNDKQDYDNFLKSKKQEQTSTQGPVQAANDTPSPEPSESVPEFAATEETEEKKEELKSKPETKKPESSEDEELITGSFLSPVIIDFKSNPKKEEEKKDKQSIEPNAAQNQEAQNLDAEGAAVSQREVKEQLEADKMGAEASQAENRGSSDDALDVSPVVAAIAERIEPQKITRPEQPQLGQSATVERTSRTEHSEKPSPETEKPEAPTNTM